MRDEVLSRELLRCDITTPGGIHASTAPLAVQPCPVCGWRLWLATLLDRICVACGYRGGPLAQATITPQDKGEDDGRI
jgi:hypothetical protein